MLTGSEGCGLYELRKSSQDEGHGFSRAAMSLAVEVRIAGSAGSRRIGEDAQDPVLGYSQPSLRDWSMVLDVTQDSRPGLLSAVPSGLSSGPANSHAASLVPEVGFSEGSRGL